MVTTCALQTHMDEELLCTRLQAGASEQAIPTSAGGEQALQQVSLQLEQNALQTRHGIRLLCG